MQTREKNFMLFGLKPDQTSYKGFLLFVAIYVGAMLIASILTPPIYWIAQYINSIYHTETTEWLVRKGVDVFFDRIRWVPIVVSLPFLMKVCGLFSIEYLGLGYSKENLGQFFKFLGFGIGIAVVIFALQATFCEIKVNPRAQFDFISLVKFFAGAVVGASIIGLLEETIFRGLIFRCCYTAWSLIPAALFTSAFFAYKHFKVPNSIWENIQGGVTHADWYTGFIVAFYDSIGVFIEFNLAEFLTLFVLSSLLILFYVRTKHLWASIGFHAGVVLAIQIYRHFFSISFTETQRVIFGSAGLSSGYLSLALLTLIFLIMWKFLPNQSESLEDKKAPNCEKN